jgi:2-dehydro-3-deoxyphosphogalactonate aldolase
MNPGQELGKRLEECPLVAIIRGVTPGEAEAIGEAIFEAGIRIIEVPLNSPDPFASIERLARRFGESALIGAGTVLDSADVARVSGAGGRVIVSPNTFEPVIEAAARAGLVSLPGFFTPSEAFTALRAGATGLKLFPAEGAAPSVVKAQRAVLPRDVPLLVVGGISPGNMQPWLDAGAQGFGLGSGLYRPGQSAEETAAKARAYVDGLRGLSPLDEMG